MRYENVWVVAGVAALGGAIAAVGGVMGWLPAPVAVAVLLGASPDPLGGLARGAPGEPVVPAAVGEPQRDRQPAE